MDFLAQHLEAIRDLCSKHHVKQLHAFGSVLTEGFGADSDVDLIVDFDTIKLEDYADNYYDLKFSLENMFNRPVDLLELQAIKNPFFKQSIAQSQRLVYG